MKTTDWMIGLAMAAWLCANPDARSANPPDGNRLSTLPPPVRQTVATLLGNGRLSDVVLTNENGQAVYEIEIHQRGVERSLTIATDGSLLARQVFLNELPPAILATVRRETAGGEIESLFWQNDDGEPGFYVEFTQGTRTAWLIVAPDGWVTSRQVEFSALPKPVQAAIREKLAGRTPTEIARAMEGDEVTFEVTETVAGKERLWIFHPDGSVAAEPMALSSLPPPAQTTLTRQSAGGRIVNVFKLPDLDTPLYEVWSVRKDARHVCTVNADGQVHSEEIPLAELPAALQTAITAKLEGRFIVRIERLPGEPDASYVVTLRRQEKIEELRLAANGSLILKSN